MAKNQVTLTFAGDTQQLERAFDKVGAGAKAMSEKVEKSSSRLNELGDKADNVATKASTATGAMGALASGVELSRLQSVKHAEAMQHEADRLGELADQAQKRVDQLKEAAEADGKLTDAEKAQIATAEAGAKAAQENADAKAKQAQASMDAATEESGLTTALMVGALAFDALSGVTDIATLAMKSNVVQVVAAKTAAVAHAVASGAVRVATIAWTAAQWLLNVALTANPIGAIIVAIAALIAVIILIATKTTWFQTAWKVSWTWIKKTAVDVWEWMKALPARLGSVFKSVSNAITAPFRAAFNFISDAWNNTIGSLSWSVPSWIPVIGGSTISAPQLPKFHSGGVVPGAPGQEVLAVLQAGERVTPAGQSGRMVLEIRSGGSRFDDAIVEIVARAVRRSGPGVIGLA